MIRFIVIGLVRRRKDRKTGKGFQLRKFSVLYRIDFEAENEDMDLENTSFVEVIAD